jgi:hypothetical protein
MAETTYQPVYERALRLNDKSWEWRAKADTPTRLFYSCWATCMKGDWLGQEANRRRRTFTVLPFARTLRQHEAGRRGEELNTIAGRIEKLCSGRS